MHTIDLHTFHVGHSAPPHHHRITYIYIAGGGGQDVQQYDFYRIFLRQTDHRPPDTHTHTRAHTQLIIYYTVHFRYLLNSCSGQEPPKLGSRTTNDGHTSTGVGLNQVNKVLLGREKKSLMWLQFIHWSAPHRRTEHFCWTDSYIMPHKMTRRSPLCFFAHEPARRGAKSCSCMRPL